MSKTITTTLATATAVVSLIAWLRIFFALRHPRNRVAALSHLRTRTPSVFLATVGVLVFAFALAANAQAPASSTLVGYFPQWGYYGGFYPKALAVNGDAG